MAIEKEESSGSIRRYNPKESIKRARARKTRSPMWRIKVTGGEYVWATKMDRVSIIRKGLPYESIEVISKRTDLPVKQVLHLFGVPQTTYNKKKRDKDLLSGRDSEVVLVLTELLDFGLEVFNHEVEKFQRWLKKPNISLGGATPESLFDSLTGIQEVRNSLNRLEYGNLA
jgi:putative toxin-antitoxin system antitoxin component (TIGR02293 family)